MILGRRDSWTYYEIETTRAHVVLDKGACVASPPCSVRFSMKEAWPECQTNSST